MAGEVRRGSSAWLVLVHQPACSEDPGRGSRKLVVAVANRTLHEAKWDAKRAARECTLHPPVFDRIEAITASGGEVRAPGGEVVQVVAAPLRQLAAEADHPLHDDLARGRALSANEETALVAAWNQRCGIPIPLATRYLGAERALSTR